MKFKITVTLGVLVFLTLFVIQRPNAGPDSIEDQIHNGQSSLTKRSLRNTLENKPLKRNLKSIRTSKEDDPQCHSLKTQILEFNLLDFGGFDEGSNNRQAGFSIERPIDFMKAVTQRFSNNDCQNQELQNFLHFCKSLDPECFMSLMKIRRDTIYNLYKDKKIEDINDQNILTSLMIYQAQHHFYSHDKISLLAHEILSINPENKTAKEFYITSSINIYRQTSDDRERSALKEQLNRKLDDYLRSQPFDLNLIKAKLALNEDPEMKIVFANKIKKHVSNEESGYSDYFMAQALWTKKNKIQAKKYLLSCTHLYDCNAALSAIDDNKTNPFLDDTDVYAWPEPVTWKEY
ncbi:hypothetical protein N9O57_00040 [bacterium]|nr:hypothetical protein [bacterium]